MAKVIDSLQMLHLQQKVHLFVCPKSSLDLDELVEEVVFVDSRQVALHLVYHESEFVHDQLVFHMALLVESEWIVD